jgi:hypothetical protein
MQSCCCMNLTVANGHTGITNPLHQYVSVAEINSTLPCVTISGILGIPLVNLTGCEIRFAFWFLWASGRCCAQHTGMHIVVVEALLVAIYLTEKKDVYMSFDLPRCLRPPSFSYLCLAEPATSWRVATETRPIRNSRVEPYTLLAGKELAILPRAKRQRHRVGRPSSR